MQEAEGETKQENLLLNCKWNLEIQKRTGLNKINRMHANRVAQTDFDDKEII